MSDVQWHKTACNLCYVNCGIEVAIENGRMGKIRGDRSNPKSQGYLCNKAARIPYYAHHKDRLTSPLRLPLRPALAARARAARSRDQERRCHL